MRNLLAIHPQHVLAGSIVLVVGVIALLVAVVPYFARYGLAGTPPPGSKSA